MEVDYIENETWLPVPGRVEFYAVSSLGRIKSLAHIDAMGRSQQERIMHPRKHNGYMQCTLCEDGGRTTVLVHRIVASAFLGPAPKGAWVHHRNEIRHDNAVGNLEYVSPHDHLWERHFTVQRIGAQHWNSKLTENDVLEIRRIYAGGEKDQSEIGRLFGVTNKNISLIALGKTWKRLLPECA